jgi:hypothetical protein
MSLDNYASLASAYKKSGSLSMEEPTKEPKYLDAIDTLYHKFRAQFKDNL